MDVTFLGAFLAGLISFISPCVLPLVPPYLCFLAGVELEELQSEERPRTVAIRSFAAAFVFVLGFATVFVALGATASLIGQTLAHYFQYLGILAGLAIIVMGLHFVGLFEIPFLNRDTRTHPEAVGLAGAYLMGLAFAFGWTPCVGPVLATILLLAGAEGSATTGSLLLATYAAGLGVPFLVAAAFTGPFLRLVARLRKYLWAFREMLGGLLIITGVLFVTGQMSTIAYWLQEAVPVLGEIG
jgi:cytochrome c-type biogenesis protein